MLFHHLDTHPVQAFSRLRTNVACANRSTAAANVSFLRRTHKKDLIRCALRQPSHKATTRGARRMH